MSKYLLKETKVMKVKNISLENGLSLNKNKMVVYNDEFIKKIVVKKIQLKYQNLLLMFNRFLENPDEEGSSILMGEIAKFESILENKYQSYLKKKVYENFIYKIATLKDGIQKTFLKKGKNKR